MLVVLDTETTGFTNNHLVELASAIYTDDGESYTWLSKAKPSTPIEDGAAQVHGITNFMVEGERPDTDVVNEWWNDITGLRSTSEPFILAGHNVAFDLRVLRKYVPIPDNTLAICTVKLGRKYNPEAPNHKLETLHQYLGLTGDYKAHSALDDVYMSADILRHYTSATGLGYLQLAGVAAQPVLLTIMPFGKHKGSTMSVVPASYMHYMLGFSDIDEDVKYTFKHELQRRDAAAGGNRGRATQ
jgi:DNA polymerase III subunit epsilon